MALAAAQAARTAKSHALFARLVEVSKTARTPKEQAAALGVPAKNIKFLRHRARRAGFDIDGTTVPRPQEVEADDDLAMMAVPPQADGPRSGKWSLEEDMLLRRGYRALGPCSDRRDDRAQGRSTSRSAQAILGIRLRARWLDSDDCRLEMLWGSAPLKQIAKEMNRFRERLLCARERARSRLRHARWHRVDHCRGEAHWLPQNDARSDPRVGRRPAEAGDVGPEQQWPASHPPVAWGSSTRWK